MLTPDPLARSRSGFAVNARVALSARLLVLVSSRLYILQQAVRVLTGKRYRLSRPTVGIQLVDKETSVVQIPANAVIKVLSGPNGNAKLHKGIVYTAWEDLTVALFAVDIEARGIEIRDENVTA